MRIITTSAGTSLELDGDVLAVIETVSRDLLREHQLDYGFEDVDRAFAHLTSAMAEDELRAYLKESLFMSFNRYENDLMSGLVRRAKQASARRVPKKKAPPRKATAAVRAKGTGAGRARAAKKSTKKTKKNGGRGR